MASKTPTYGKDLPGNLGTDNVLRAIYDKIGDSSSDSRIEEKLDVIFDLLINVNTNIETNTQAIKDISINVDIHTKDITAISNAIILLTEVISQLTEAIKNIQVHIDTDNLNNYIQKIATNIEDGFDKTAKAIQDISINVDSNEICDRIDKVNQSVNNLDNNIKDGFDRTINTIKKSKPCPRPIPPCPPPSPEPYYPETKLDIIFYPVNNLPAPVIHYPLPNCNRIKHYNYNEDCRCKPQKNQNKCKIILLEEQRLNSLKNFDPFYTPYNPSCPPYGIEKKTYEPKIRYPKNI